jgi:hypothetical protein
MIVHMLFGTGAVCLMLWAALSLRDIELTLICGLFAWVATVAIYLAAGTQIDQLQEEVKRLKKYSS